MAMNILILGATGKTGRLLVAQALEQGHDVTAFARHPATMTIQHERLRVVQGDMLDAASVDAAVRGQDAVISALGTEVLRKNTLLSDGTKNIIAAMEQHAIRRFICMSSLGVGDSQGQLGWIYNWLLIPLLLRNIFQDKEVQERYIKQSGLDWIIVRPGVLTNGPRTGVYRAGFSPTDHSIKAKISRADVADFMLKQLTAETYIHQTPGVSY
jgi:putative NADH-flavin reductase